MLEGWMLAAIDRAGYNGIRDEHIEALAQEIFCLGLSYVGSQEFQEVCRNCGIDPDTFTQADLDALQTRLNG